MERPIRVFKYMPIRSCVKNCGRLRIEDISHVKDILCKKQLHFTKWYDMNDIFEGHYILKDDVFNDAHDEVIGLLLQKLRFHLTCFSRSLNSHLMWSHYASAHTGVAIELTISKEGRTELDGNDIVIEDMRYLESNTPSIVTKSEIINAVHDSSKRKLRELIFKMLLTKTECWGYEKEIRMIIDSAYWNSENVQRNKYRLIPEKGEKVNAVYFGNRIAVKDAREIKRLCEAEGVKWYYMNEVDDTFQDARSLIVINDYLASYPIPDTEFCPLENALSEENYEVIE